MATSAFVSTLSVPAWARMVCGFHSALVMPVRVAAVGPAVGATAAGAAAVVGAAAAAGGALVAAGGGVVCWLLRPHAASSGSAASVPVRTRNERRLRLE